jgi:hypothetical protein
LTALWLAKTTRQELSSTCARRAPVSEIPPALSYHSGMAQYRIEKLEDGKYKVTRLGKKPSLLTALTRVELEQYLKDSVSPTTLAAALKRLDAGEEYVEVDADLE